MPTRRWCFVSSAICPGCQAAQSTPSSGLPLSPGASRLADHVQGGLAARGFPLFKIPLALSHLVRHVCKTDDLVLPGLRQRIEACSLHFHRQNALAATPPDPHFHPPNPPTFLPTH